MAIYDAGTASLAADGTVTGIGTTWRQPLTLIRVGATMIFNTTPASIVTIAEIISDTEIRVFNDKGFTATAGTQYSILAHDGITVQGLAQDVAETLRYYQSRETEVAAAVDAFNQFDADAFQQSVTNVNNQSHQVATDAAQVSSDKADVSADKDAAAGSAESAQKSAREAASSASSVSGALIGSFQGGITIQSSSQQIIDLRNGTAKSYLWAGDLPKVVPESSTPESTGGISSSAWIPLASSSSARSVADLSSLAGSIGSSVYLDSYIEGLAVGGGRLTAVDESTIVDNVSTFNGNGVVWKRDKNTRSFTVSEAGYTDGLDIAIFINRINSSGFDCIVNTNGTVFSSVEIDISKGALIGSGKCILKEGAGATGDYFLRVFNSNSDYTDRDPLNSTSLIEGVAFVGLGARRIAFGGAGSGEVAEVLISRCGFISTGGIEFLDNSYRLLFDKCTVSRSFNNTVVFNSPQNSGEVMKFHHCWVVDNGGPLTFNNGQFIFDSCSMPAGQKDGYPQPTVILNDNATTVFSNGNIEYQPGQSFVGFSVNGSSRLSVKDTTVVVYDGFSSVPFVSNGDSVVSLSNCSLPLYGVSTIATGFPTRQIVGGDSSKVSSYGCYPRSGFILSNWNLGSIVSPYINSVANNSAQSGVGSGWSFNTLNGTPSVSVNNDVPQAAMFGSSFVISIPDSVSSSNFVQNVYRCEPGRYFQFGFWAKNTTRTLASIRFLSSGVQQVGDSIGYYIPQDGEFDFYAVVSDVPPGAERAEINFNCSDVAGGLVIHNVIYGLI